MKNMKKILALVISTLLVLSMVSALADLGDLPVDAKIEITNLDDGDTVNVYKVVEWIDGQGWQMVPPYRTVTAGANDGDPDVITYATGCQDIENKLNAGTALTAADVAALAAAVQGNTANKYDYVASLSGTTYTKNNPDAGMYIALVAPATVGTVYNPIIVSADFSNSNATNVLNAEGEVIVGTSTAKKKDITVEKTEPKVTNDVGDTYTFTIQTTIPSYSAAFTNTFFTVSDTMSSHLDLVPSSIAVKDTDTNEAVTVTDYTTTAAHSFDITFPHAYVSALTAAKNITITYNATLNVPVTELTNVTEEDNKVYVKFPNNPNSNTGKDITVLRDGTVEYTFSIDANILGNSSYKTSELVKVGKDKDGNIIEELVELDNKEKHGALKGARFGVYTNAESAQAETTTLATFNADGTVATHGLYTNTRFNGYVTSDEKGLMNIPGLDVGTYYIKELDAPNGYIRDMNAHYFTIAATWNENVAVTEYYTVANDGTVTWYKDAGEGRTAYTYYIPKVLKGYTVTVDGSTASSYTWTNNGPHIETVTPGDVSTEIVNTKGVELPSTGGMGTTLLYVGGSILVVLAAILLITKRRMSSED